jgi:predicted alpha/beta hydrolase family esterase
MRPVAVVCRGIGSASAEGEEGVDGGFTANHDFRELLKKVIQHLMWTLVQRSSPRHPRCGNWIKKVHGHANMV